MFDALFGLHSPARVPIHDEQSWSVGEHYCRIDTPVEKVLLDLYLHSALPFELPPRVALYSLLHARLRYPLSQQEECLLPVPGRVRELGSPPMVSTPVARRHSELVELACAALERPLDEFRGYRYELEHPPIPSILVLHHPLAPSARGT